MTSAEKFFYHIGISGGYLLCGLLFAFIIKWTWNYTMPYLLNMPELSWLRAYCLFILVSFLATKPHAHCDKNK